MTCAFYDAPEAAFARVLEDRPTVLAIGETHAQAGEQSTTARFSEKFLPMLAGKSSDLVLELWIGNSACSAKQKKAMSAVQSASREVTKTQSAKNPSDFVALYTAARNNGIATHLLVPECEEYAQIAAADNDIDAMLSMIARLTAEQTEALIGKAREPIVIYGGAMHNDLFPRHAEWSFGPALDKKTKYVELDLIAAEMIKDTEAWRAQPWYEHFTRGAQGHKTLLFSVFPRSYALIFP